MSTIIQNIVIYFYFYSPKLFSVQDSIYRVTDRFVEFQLKKAGSGETWPRLTYDQKKPPWLKIDFDHFCFADDSEPDDDLLMVKL